MGKQCNVSSLSCKGTVTVSQCTNTCQRAPCTSPVASTGSSQGNFLARETRWWWCLRCRSAVDMTSETLPQLRARCSTFNYMRIVTGRAVKGTRAVKGPGCWEPGVYAGKYGGILYGAPFCSLKTGSTCKLGEVILTEMLFPVGGIRNVDGSRYLPMNRYQTGCNPIRK